MILAINCEFTMYGMEFPTIFLEIIQNCYFQPVPNSCLQENTGAHAVIHNKFNSCYSLYISQYCK